MDELQSIRLYLSFYLAAQEIEDKEQRCDYYDAILRYGFYGLEPELKGIANAMFILTRPNLDTSRKKSLAGATGGKSKSEANCKQTESKPQPIEEGRRKKEDRRRKIEENTPQPPKWGKPSGFEKFWAAYPKKVGKQAAQKAWSRLKPNNELTETILQAIERQKSSIQWSTNNGQFIPNPTTWLNQGRWEDEVQTPTGCSSGVQSGYTLGESELNAIAKLKQLRDEIKGENNGN